MLLSSPSPLSLYNHFLPRKALASNPTDIAQKKVGVDSKPSYSPFLHKNLLLFGMEKVQKKRKRAKNLTANQKKLILEYWQKQGFNLPPKAIREAMQKNLSQFGFVDTETTDSLPTEGALSMLRNKNDAWKEFKKITAVKIPPETKNELLDFALNMLSITQAYATKTSFFKAVESQWTQAEKMSISQVTIASILNDFANKNESDSEKRLHQLLNNIYEAPIKEPG